MTPLESVQDELVAALGQRAEIDKKIEALKQSAKMLEPIYGRRPRKVGVADLMRVGRVHAEDIKNLGITAAVERILINNAGAWLPPTSVRNGLKEAGFELVGDNPLASIHQVLKRLVVRGENSPFVSREFQGQKLYKYDVTRLSTAERLSDALGE
jgi:hypothetical protein